MPVFANVLYRSAEEARAAPQAPMDLSSCPDCGHVWNRSFDPGRLDYDVAYDATLEASPTFRAFTAGLVEDLGARHALADGLIVDVGCGRGAFLAELTDGTGSRGVGYDASYDGPTEVGGARFVTEFLTEANRPSEPVSLVVNRHVLEHLAAPSELVELVGRLAARDGAGIYLEVPNGLFTLRDGSLWDLIYEHHSYFVPSSLARLVTDCGLRVESLAETYGSQFLSVHCTTAGRAVPGASDVADIAVPAPELVATFGERSQRQLEQWRTGVAGCGDGVAVWGAGSKGVTFVNLMGAPHIDAVIDINERKQGTFVPGTDRVVSAPEHLRELDPGVVFVMNPLYRDEIASTVRDLGLAAELRLVH